MWKFRKNNSKNLMIEIGRYLLEDRANTLKKLVQNTLNHDLDNSINALKESTRQMELLIPELMIPELKNIVEENITNSNHFIKETEKISDNIQIFTRSFTEEIDKINSPAEKMSMEEIYIKMNSLRDLEDK